MNIDSLFLIDPDKYPNLKPIIKEIQEWDRETHANSYGAGAYGILYSYLRKYSINRLFLAAFIIIKI